MAPCGAAGRGARRREIRASSRAAEGARQPLGRRLGGPYFKEWLRVQLRSRRMSQRQLASRSGVSHATISRLLGEGRDPNLGTAMKLVRVLLELQDDADAQYYVALLSRSGDSSPAARVEDALQADEALDDLTVRRVMDYYLAIRDSSPRPRARSA